MIDAVAEAMGAGDHHTPAPVLEPCIYLWALASSPARGTHGRGPGPPCPPYRPRDTQHSVLHSIIGEHLDPFLREVSDRGDGHGLPRFAEQQFRDFLTCGVLTHGFTRLQCADCTFERLAPFSSYAQRETICSCQFASDRKLWEYSSLWS